MLRLYYSGPVESLWHTVSYTYRFATRPCEKTYQPKFCRKAVLRLRMGLIVTSVWMDNPRCSPVFLTDKEGTPQMGGLGTYVWVKETICSEAQAGIALRNFGKKQCQWALLQPMKTNDWISGLFSGPPDPVLWEPAEGPSSCDPVCPAGFEGTCEFSFSVLHTMFTGTYFQWILSLPLEGKTSGT